MNKERLLRGSSWRDLVSRSIVTDRIDYSYTSSIERGFRVVRNPEFCVVRGSSWSSVPNYLHIAHCDSNHPNNKGSVIGFRMILNE